MNEAVYSLIFALCVSHMAQAVSIQDITLKIAATQRYLANEVWKHQTEIPKAIDNTKTELRNRAEEIKNEIRGGPNSCYNWLGQIDTILQYQINFEYAFNTCQKASDINNMDKIKYSLQDLQKSANQLISTCSMVGNCQSSINSLYNSVGLIEADIGFKSAAISTSSTRCISDMKTSIEKSLNEAQNYWKKCANK